MREIKFKAWTGDEIVEVMIIDWQFNTIHFARNLKDKEWVLLPGASLDKCKLIQYTGLKDKNGREGYWKDNLGGLLSECYIDWCDKCCSVQLFCCYTKDCLCCGGDILWYEVVDSIRTGESWFIGNQYENPELLGGK